MKNLGKYYSQVMDMKRIFAGMAAALLAAVSFFPVKAQALSAQKAILMDAHTGRVLYECRADEQSLIASTTKIMTALVVCEQCNVLDRMRIPSEAVGVEGSSMYLKAGEVLTVQELLYGLMLHSGNDAATALAVFCGGTVEGFAQLMNDKAHRLGLTNTHFVNPHGLDAPGHYSTARDLAVLAAYAMENPIFAQTVSTKTVNAGGRSLRNHNKLLWQVEGADGVKTGYTRSAGRILVSSAKRQDRRLVAVTICDPDDWRDHAALMEDGFAKYKRVKVVEQGTVLAVAEVEGGQEKTVELMAGEDVYYSLMDGETLQLRVGGTGFFYAPVVRGQSAGRAHLYLNDTCVGSVALVCANTVEQTQPEQPWWQKLLGGRKL